jgi:predicted MFS family arabinose efflux permease
MYLGITYGWYFNITYLPSYLERRFEPAAGDLLAAMYKGGPLWVGAAGCLAGGLIVRRLARWCGDQGSARRLLGVTALSLCALFWTAAIYAPNMHVFFLCVSGGALLNDLVMGSAWATCQDLGGRHAGVTAAWMNTMGTIGAGLAGWITGQIVQSAKQAHEAAATLPTELTAMDAKAAELAGYDRVFVSYAVVYAVAAFCWLRIDPRRTIE